MTAPAPALVTTPLQPATWSALYASRFPIWPLGEDWATLTPGQQAHVCGGWRVVAGHSATTGPTVRVRKADAVQGGLELEATFGAATDQPVYVRQLVPNLPQLAGRSYGPTFCVSSAQPQQWDVYARSRYSEDDAHRLPVVDSAVVTTPAGESVLTIPATVPVLDAPAAAGWPLTWRSCVEIALRLWGTSSTRRAVIRWASMPLGAAPAAPPMVTPRQDSDAVAAYEQLVPFRLTGLSSELGQKSTSVAWQEKALPVSRTQVVPYDALGNRGFVSGYVRDGRRVDRVPVSIGGDLQTGLQTGCAVVLANPSTYVGLSGRLHVASY